MTSSQPPADPAHPPGCLVISAALTCADAEVMASLRDRRNANIALFERRVRTGVAAGVLPVDTDATALARFVGAVLQGMSLQARDGAGRREPRRAGGRGGDRTARLAGAVGVAAGAAASALTGAEKPAGRGAWRDPQPARHRSPECFDRASVRARAAVGEDAAQSGQRTPDLTPPTCAGRAEALDAFIVD
ncbi:hypothetical protein ACWEV4_04845 [Streptomyces sp. NPDC003860]